MSSVTSFELPVRKASNEAGDIPLQEKFRLLRGLVERVKSLEHVRVKSIPFELDSGEVVYVPGPWAIAKTPPHTDDDEDGALGDESESDSSQNSHRFVARSEFGHIRLQSFLTAFQSPDHFNAEAVGGHCVLPPAVFKHCVEKQWGTAHPFAGRFHPIVDSVVPETTLVFKAPRSAEEAQELWKIIQLSYLWAVDKYQAI